MANYKMLENVTFKEQVAQWRFRVKILRIFPYHVPAQKPCIPASIIWHFILVDEAGTRIEMLMPQADAKRFPGIENGECDWAEIYNVKVIPGCSTPFKWEDSRCRLQTFERTQIDQIQPMNDHHYLQFISIHEALHTYKKDKPIDIMGVVFNEEPLDVCLTDHKNTKLVFYIRDNVESQIKCVAIGDCVYAFQEGLRKIRGRGMVIAVLKMWKIADFLVDEPWLKTHEGISDFRLNPHMDDVEYSVQSLANNDAYVAAHGPIVFNICKTWNVYVIWFSIV